MHITLVDHILWLGALYIEVGASDIVVGCIIYYGWVHNILWLSALYVAVGASYIVIGASYIVVG